MTGPLLDWAGARAEAHRQGALLRTRPETIALDDAIGRTLASDLLSPGDVPGHDGAAMDGWAISGDGPWTIGVALVAGSVPDLGTLDSGHARPITTGAPVPRGTDVVLRSEDGVLRPDGLLERRPAGERRGSERRHIRPAAEEVGRGDLLFAAGTVITPPRAALAAASGVDVVVVAIAPTVHLAVLGDEIDGVGVPLPGRVRDVFTRPFPSILRSVGAEAVSTVRVSDEVGVTMSALDQPGVRLVVTTGGTARSSTDHIRPALAGLGARLVVDQVDMRPGHPAMIARRADTLYLCLPGNPMAAMATLVGLGIPLIDGLLGRPLAVPRPVVLAVDVPNDRGGDLVLAFVAGGAGVAGNSADKAEYDSGMLGAVVPATRQTSAMLRGLADADGLMIVPPGGGRRGDVVPSVPLPW